MRAADIMTTKVFTIDSLATVADAIALMQDKKVRSLIVEPGEDKVYGYFGNNNYRYSIGDRAWGQRQARVYRSKSDRNSSAIALDRAIKKLH